MDNTEFLISFVSSLTLFDVKKMNEETLKTFLKSYNGSPTLTEDFKEVSLDSESIDLTLGVLQRLNILKRKKFFRRVILESTLPKDMAMEILGTCKEEEIVGAVAFALKYKKHASVLEEVKDITYEERYTPITKEFVADYCKDTISLIKSRKGN